MEGTLSVKAQITHLASVRKGVAEIRRDAESALRVNDASTRSQRAYAGAIDGTVQATRRMGAATGQATQQQVRLQRAADAAARSQRSHADDGIKRALAMARGIAGVAAAYGSVRLAAQGGMAALKAYESQKGYGMAMRLSLGAKAPAVMSEVDAFANKQGLDLQSTRSAAQRLAASGSVTPEQLVETIRAFTAYAASSGATAEQTSRAFIQYVQVANSPGGKLQGDELNSMQESNVLLISLLKKAGYGDRIGSQSDPLRFSEINDALLKWGKTPDAQAMLASTAQNATSSLQRLANVVQTELLPPIGEALTPAVKQAAASLQEFAKGLDPERIKATTKALVDYGPTVLAVGAGIVGVAKVVQFALSAKLAISAAQAAFALDRLSLSAGVAGGGGGGGMATGAMAGAGGGSRFGGVGTFVGGAVGGIAGAYGASQFTDNPYAIGAGAVAGNIGGALATRAAINGIAKMAASRGVGVGAQLAADAIVAQSGAAAATGASGVASSAATGVGAQLTNVGGTGVATWFAPSAAAGGEVATGVGAGSAAMTAGIAAGVAAIETSIPFLIGAATDAVMGKTGAEDSVMAGMFGKLPKWMGGQGGIAQADPAQELTVKEMATLRARRASYQRNFELDRMPTIDEYYRGVNGSDPLARKVIQERDARLGRTPASSDSPRKASMDAWTSEASARATRQSL